jgi:hypothetical protein
VQIKLNLFYIKTLCTFAEALFMKNFFDFIKTCMQYVCFGVIGQNKLVAKKYETPLAPRFQGFLLSFTKFNKYLARLGFVQQGYTRNANA